MLGDKVWPSDSEEMISQRMFWYLARIFGYAASRRQLDWYLVA